MVMPGQHIDLSPAGRPSGRCEHATWARKTLRLLDRGSASEGFRRPKIDWNSRFYLSGKLSNIVIIRPRASVNGHSQPSDCTRPPYCLALRYFMSPETPGR